MAIHDLAQKKEPDRKAQENRTRGGPFSWFWNSPMAGWLILAAASATAYFRYHETRANFPAHTWAGYAAIGLMLILILGAVALLGRLIWVNWPRRGDARQIRKTASAGGSTQAVILVLLLLGLMLLVSHRAPPRVSEPLKSQPMQPEVLQPVPTELSKNKPPPPPAHAKHTVKRQVTEATPVAVPSPVPQTPGHIAGEVVNEIPNVMDLIAGHKAESPLKLNDNVHWDDAVRTVDLGRARLELLDGSLLNIGARSTMKIIKHDPETQQTAIELTVGRVRAEVAKQTKPGSSFQIRTPTAVIGVVGTIFLIDARGSETDTCVTEGVVSLQNIDPAVVGQIGVNPGECARVLRGQPPTLVPPLVKTSSVLAKLTAIPDPVPPVVDVCVQNVSAERRDAERRSFDRLNEMRRQAGAHELQWSDALADVARRHSCRMMAVGFFDHVDPEYGELLQRMSAGRLDTNSVAENVFQERGHDDPGPFSVDRLMTSPSHRRNILDPDFRSCGVGIAVAEDGTYFSTEIFNAAVPSILSVPGR